jgi:hypothetical protein
MPRYVWDAEAGALVEVVAGPRAPSAFPQVMRAMAAYRSPMSMSVVEDRAARREEMKRYGVREVDTSEKPKRPDTPGWVKDWRAGHGVARAKPE